MEIKKNKINKKLKLQIHSIELFRHDKKKSVNFIFNSCLLLIWKVSENKFSVNFVQLVYLVIFTVLTKLKMNQVISNQHHWKDL